MRPMLLNIKSEEKLGGVWEQCVLIIACLSEVAFLVIQVIRQSGFYTNPWIMVA